MIGDTESIRVLTGTFAEREHRKWIDNAVELRNNPYSKESIEKRLNTAGGGRISGVGYQSSNIANTSNSNNASWYENAISN